VLPVGLGRNGPRKVVEPVMPEEHLVAEKECRGAEHPARNRAVCVVLELCLVRGIGSQCLDRVERETGAFA